MADYKIDLTTGKEIPLQELKSNGLAVIKSVFEIASNNRQLIDEKKAKASAAIAAALKAVKVIENEKQDKYFNDLIVIVNNTIADMEKLRKEYTSKVNAWLKEEIAPENELKLENAKLIEMRNARARRIKEEADKKNAEIQREKNRLLYESEVKGLMKLSFERGLIEKVVAFEKSLDDYFYKNLTAANAGKMKTAFEGMKPGLKEDFFLSMFQVDFDPARMSPDEYDALVKRAKGFWTYEEINKRYVTEANAIIKKYIDKIPQRVKELELIAKGGEQGERVKKIVEEREANERAEAAKEAADKINTAARTINEEVAGERISAEFKAQAQEQKLEQPIGTRNKRIVTIDSPGDTRKLGNIIAAIVMHMIPNKSADDRIKLVLQCDADGKPKVDKDGDPVYTTGVQFWLDQALTLPYTPDIEGLSFKTKVSTVAKKK